MEEKYLGAKVAIEESEKVLKEQMKSVGAFKTHQGRLLTVLGFILSVIGLLIGLRDDPLEITPVVIIILGSLFLGFVCIYAFIVAPVELEMPVKIDFDIFKEVFIGKQEKTILENRLANYIKAVRNNGKKTNRLYVWSWISTVIFVSILMIVVCTIIALI